MDKNFDLEIYHPDYLRNKSLRDKSHVLFEGRQEDIENLLIKGTYEDQRYFQERQKTLVYENLLRPIIAARVGLLTRRKIEISVPENIAQYLYDFDGEGVNVQTWVKDVITDADVDGIVWAVVDMPDTTMLVDDEGEPLIRTRSDEMAANIRPFVRSIPADNVIRWKVNPSDFRLDWAVIKSCVVKEDNLGSRPIVQDRWVVWSREDIKVYEKKKTDSKFHLISEAPNMLGEVPLVPFYGIRDKARFTGLPFGYLILDHLVKILNIESQKHHGLELIAMPRMYIIGERPPTEVPTVDNAFFLPIGRDGNKPDLGYIEPSGKGIELSSKEIESLIHRVYRNTLYLSRKSTAQVQSADSQKQESTVLKADLSSVAYNHESSLREVLRLLYKWETVGLEPDNGDIQVQFTRDFDVRKLEASEIKELREATVGDLLSLQTFWKLLVSGEVLPESFDSEEEMINISEEKDVKEKNLSIGSV